MLLCLLSSITEDLGGPPPSLDALSLLNSAGVLPDMVLSFSVEFCVWEESSEGPAHVKEAGHPLVVT